jgi:hypothetical protein
MMLGRENATAKEALPHEYVYAENAIAGGGCEVCSMDERDERHLAWQHEQQVGRERANMRIEREIGS